MKVTEDEILLDSVVHISSISANKLNDNFYQYLNGLLTRKFHSTLI